MLFLSVATDSCLDKHAWLSCAELGILLQAYSIIVACRVKFGAFYEHLEAHFGDSFDRIGSGHYARLVRDPVEAPASQVRLAMTPDAIKDQTYFLAHLSQEQLARTIFPLGTLTKVGTMAL